MIFFVPTAEYIRNDDFVDLVFFDDGTYNNVNSGRGHYYYISDMARTNKNGATYYAPAATDGSGNTYDYLSGIRTLAPGYGLVITQGVFAEFAKLGKAIMSGDCMFSTNGRIGSTEYNDGALLGGVPAYTSFSPEMAEGKTLFLTLAQVSSVKETYTPFTETFPVIAGVTYTITVTAKTNTSEGKAYFTTNQGNGYIDAVNGTSYQTITKNITATRTGTGYVSACVDASGQAVTIKSVTVQGGFEPNWWVDLRTGKMSAARGNFVVEPSGNVYVSGRIDAKLLYLKPKILTPTAADGSLLVYHIDPVNEPYSSFLADGSSNNLANVQIFLPRASDYNGMEFSFMALSINALSTGWDKELWVYPDAGDKLIFFSETDEKYYETVCLETKGFEFKVKSIGGYWVWSSGKARPMGQYTI